MDRRDVLGNDGLELAGSGGSGDTPAVDGTPGGAVSRRGRLAAVAPDRARSLEADRDGGRVVFTPAVVWIETGAPVTWQIEGVTHSLSGAPVVQAHDAGDVAGGHNADAVLGMDGVRATFAHSFDEASNRDRRSTGEAPSPADQAIRGGNWDGHFCLRRGPAARVTSPRRD